MSLRGIDISNWKSDFNPSVVDYDFLIVQCTWGGGELTVNGIVDSVWPGADGMIQKCLARGKKMGYMHYIRGRKSAKEEAEFFVNNTKGYLHKGIPMVDWENGDNSVFGDYSYLSAWVERFIELTDVPPMIYAGAKDYAKVAEVGKRFNCGLHIAQYADTDTHIGYQGSPWNEGAYTCAIRQYSSTTYIQGYSGRLDVNKFYGDEAAWDRYANPKGAKPQESPKPSPTPTPNPVPNNSSSSIKVGQSVRIKSGARDLNSGSTFASFVYETTYTVIEASGSRVVFGKGGAVTGVVKPSDVVGYSGTSSSSSDSSAIKVGDSVKVINPVDYNGTRIALYYDRYTVMELRGDRAVIGVNGTVTCAIKVSNLRK